MYGSKNQVFQSFYRGYSLGKIKDRRLGIAIVENCVKLHGVQITIDSEFGETTVMIALSLNLSVSYWFTNLINEPYILLLIRKISMINN